MHAAQGIVPAKAGDMAFRLVEMVTTTLVSVPEVLARLDPQASALFPPAPYNHLQLHPGRACRNHALTGQAVTDATTGR